MNHLISFEQASAMTERYRSEKENVLAPEYKGQNILCISESYDRGAVDYVLSQKGCVGVRIYYGMDESLKVHAIVVGYDADGRDIIHPTTSGALAQPPTQDPIMEEGNRCPDNCPQASGL